MSKFIVSRTTRSGKVLSATVEADSPTQAITTSGIATATKSEYKVKTLTGKPGRPKIETLTV